MPTAAEKLACFLAEEATLRGGGTLPWAYYAERRKKIAACCEEHLRARFEYKRLMTGGACYVF